MGPMRLEDWYHSPPVVRAGLLRPLLLLYVVCCGGFV